MTTLCMLAIIMVFQNCAPTFSDLQSARMVGKGNFEVTPNYSSVAFHADGESEKVQNHVGSQFAFGLSENVDLRMRFEHIWISGDYSFSEQIFGIGPKVNIVRDRLAAYLPVGFAFSDIGESLEIHPTVLGTLPIVRNRIDFNPSAKYLFLFCEGCDNLVAFNFGFAISDNVTRWAVRPEYGLLLNPGEDGRYSQFSLGLSYSFLKKK